MIPYWLATALMVMPCNSDVQHGVNTTVAHQCPLPQIQGPLRPPIWWRAGMFDDTTKTVVDRPAAVKQYKAKPKKKKKRKKRKR